MRKKEVPDYCYIFDPTVPTVEVGCPECGYGKAIVFLVSDGAETKMVARMMCRSVMGSTVKCGHTWTLSDESEITNLAIRIKVQDDE